jgi:hypothetical protein
MVNKICILKNNTLFLQTKHKNKIEMKKIIGICIAIILAIGVFSVVGMYFSYNNTDARLRAQVEAQIGKVEGVHDKMWKVLQQKAQVSNEYKDAFSEIYPALIEGRYSQQGDGSLMKWITEANPTFDTSLYKDLMQSIELLRTEFQKAQERTLDLIREHNVLLTTVPSKWFVSNKEKIEYTVISSTRSKTVMETGLDDDINLF